MGFKGSISFGTVGLKLCEFSETPPALFQPEPVNLDVLAEEIMTSFYHGLDAKIAIYPSLEDALAALAYRLGGLEPLPDTPMFLRKIVERLGLRGGGAILAASPTPRGDALLCEVLCESRKPVVVYEGLRVAQPTPTVLECGCNNVYSLGWLRDYGLGSSVAWVTGLEGGLQGGVLPGYHGLSRLVPVVRRFRLRNLAILNGILGKPEVVGPFAAFYHGKAPPFISVDAGVYGLEGFKAVTLFASRLCYVMVSRVA